jgi:hypothetical protein
MHQQIYYHLLTYIILDLFYFTHILALFYNENLYILIKINFKMTLFLGLVLKIFQLNNIKSQTFCYELKIISEHNTSKIEDSNLHKNKT